MSYRKLVVEDEFVEDIRTYLGDLPEFNELVEGTEISDEKIRLATRLYVNHFNAVPPKLSKEFRVSDFPSALVLFQGVTIQILTMLGLIQTRNFLNFRDDNVSFQLNDKSQDYQQWINHIMQTHNQAAGEIKVGINATEAFDFIHSPDGATGVFF